MAIGSSVASTFKAADVVASFHLAFAVYGFPASVLTDNGAVFTAAYRGASRCTIELELARLGIAYRHSRPYHPQTCGKVERFHQTMKKWLSKQPPVSSLQELHAQLEWFCRYYNEQRPHRAIGRRTPVQAFTARPKAVPTLDGSLVSPHFRVRHDTVSKSGNVSLRYNSRLHHIGVGRAHKNKRVLVLVADLEVRVVTEDGEILAELTLDPSVNYQRQG